MDLGLAEVRDTSERAIVGIYARNLLAVPIRQPPLLSVRAGGPTISSQSPRAPLRHTCGRIRSTCSVYFVSTARTSPSRKRNDRRLRQTPQSFALDRRKLRSVRARQAAGRLHFHAPRKLVTRTDIILWYVRVARQSQGARAQCGVAAGVGSAMRMEG